MNLDDQQRFGFPVGARVRVNETMPTVAYHGREGTVEFIGRGPKTKWIRVKLDETGDPPFHPVEWHAKYFDLIETRT